MGTRTKPAIGRAPRYGQRSVSAVDLAFLATCSLSLRRARRHDCLHLSNPARCRNYCRLEETIVYGISPTKLGFFVLRQLSVSIRLFVQDREAETSSSEMPMICKLWSRYLFCNPQTRNFKSTGRTPGCRRAADRDGSGRPVRLARGNAKATAFGLRRSGTGLAVTSLMMWE
jgi:hypothetical protein